MNKPNKPNKPKKQSKRPKKNVPFLRSSEWKNLRAEALQRDGNKCVLCGCEEKLNVHHILYRRGFKQHALELQNLVTLCSKHHALGPQSVHRGCGGILLVEWLRLNRPQQYQWVMTNINVTC